ncbi:hypothetical protein DQ04_08771020 [Trypanosoma grayi]|uniref:hypothetical protein n=1 Tax=Trypanosoma grayi TaxID=71804 RepID=UPI0004F4606F|nr:hypothetical protein DQ04_08771020 [Trypanosoma grayi]KEG07809.1 hypothetical protein DQ04_08771020 [Trypanosoma grayi]
MGVIDEDRSFFKLLINDIEPGTKWSESLGGNSGLRSMMNIISTKRNGMNTDKADYVLWDTLNSLVICEDFSVGILLQVAQVEVDDNDEMHIAYDHSTSGRMNRICRLWFEMCNTVYHAPQTMMTDRKKT